MTDDNRSSDRAARIFIAILGLLGLLIILAIPAFFIFSVKVRPAEVAIIVDLYGSDKGVEIDVLPTGRNFYNRITHDIIIYPAAIQQGIYDDVSFQDVDGLTLSADIAINYKFESENIPFLYQEYRKDADFITANYFNTWIRNAMVEQSSKMKVDEIYGEKKEEFRDSVLAQLREEFNTKGIYIEDIYFTNGIQIPPEVSARINDKIQATQIAQQKQNELAAVEADVQKVIAEEEGKAKSRIIEANSRSEANNILNNSLTPNVLRFKELELQKEAIGEWNGVVPMVQGSGEGLILDLGTLK